MGCCFSSRANQRYDPNDPHASDHSSYALHKHDALQLADLSHPSKFDHALKPVNTGVLNRKDEFKPSEANGDDCESQQVLSPGRRLPDMELSLETYDIEVGEGHISFATDFYEHSYNPCVCFDRCARTQTRILHLYSPHHKFAFKFNCTAGSQIRLTPSEGVSHAREVGMTRSKEWHVTVVLTKPAEVLEGATFDLLCVRARDTVEPAGAAECDRLLAHAAATSDEDAPSGSTPSSASFNVSLKAEYQIEMELLAKGALRRSSDIVFFEHGLLNRALNITNSWKSCILVKWMTTMPREYSVRPATQAIRPRERASFVMRYKNRGLPRPPRPPRFLFRALPVSACTAAHYHALAEDSKAGYVNNMFKEFKSELVESFFVIEHDNATLAGGEEGDADVERIQCDFEDA